MAIIATIAMLIKPIVIINIIPSYISLNAQCMMIANPAIIPTTSNPHEMYIANPKKAKEKQMANNTSNT